MTLFIGNIPKLQHLELRSFRSLLGILFLMVPFFIPRSGLASELGNVLAEAHFTAYGWQSTAMRIEGSYTDRTWKELHLAQLRTRQQVIIRFHDVSPSTLFIRHSGTYHQGKSQTFINVTVNGHLVEQGYLVPGHLDPGTASAASAMPPLKSWQVSKWMRPGENNITISLHSSAATVYWLTDVWLSGSQDFGQSLKEKRRTKDDVFGVGSDKKTQYEKDCDNGDAKACLDLGYMYGTGKGVKLNYGRALSLYEKACDGGNANGCTNLGIMYRDGLGVAQDYRRAIALFEKGCHANHAPGCTELGHMYDSGKGVAQDHRRAVDLYETACDGGNANGCTNLGIMYRDGLGVAQDYPKAVTFYEKACHANYAPGCTDLGYMYDSGKGVKQDSSRAMELYEKGCEGGNAVGCANLGWMYYQGRGLAPDRSRARAFLEKACALGNQLGCDRLREIR